MLFLLFLELQLMIFLFLLMVGDKVGKLSLLKMIHKEDWLTLSEGPVEQWLLPQAQRLLHSLQIILAHLCLCNLSVFSQASLYQLIIYWSYYFSLRQLFSMRLASKDKDGVVLENAFKGKQQI